jgi:hypothetical protein
VNEMGVDGDAGTTVMRSRSSSVAH